MKRKLYGDKLNSVYGAPPLESTLLIDTGGVEEFNGIGKMPSTTISASVSSGTRNFQYNRFFWNKELFTFDYYNCGIGVAISYWNNETVSFAIYPIFLPRIAMTILQNITKDSPTDDPALRNLLLDELLYYLNLGWTSYGMGNNTTIPLNPGTVTQPVVRTPPIMLAQDVKGCLLLNSTPTFQTLNNPFMPIFSDTTPPPLLWKRVSSNGQIGLFRNPDYWNNPLLAPAGSDIAFQIITMQEFFASAPLSSLNSAIVTAANLYGGLLSLVSDAMLDEGQGWCTQGAFATGFGQVQNYEGSGKPFSYTDIYTTPERRSLFADTVFPNYIGSMCSYSFWLSNFVNKHKLSRTCVTSFFITSLIPYRFFTIESDALTRNQKRPVVSNNPNLGPNTVAIQPMTLDGVRTWTDGTVAGSAASTGSLLFGARKSGNDDATIVSMDPMQSIQTLDITMKDEWGNVIQNFNQFITNASPLPQIMGMLEGMYNPPGAWNPIPPWVAALNPNTAGGNTESILFNESWWQNLYQIMFFNPTLGQKGNFLPTQFAPMAPRSSTIIHFGRVLGY